jgi:hypothetical protein
VPPAIADTVSVTLLEEAVAAVTVAPPDNE